MQQILRKKQIIFIGFSFAVVLIAFGVWRYYGPIAASQAYLTAINNGDSATISNMHCVPGLRISHR